LLRKRKVMKEDVNLSNVREREVGRMLKRGLTLAVFIKDRHAWFIQRGCHGKADGEKKVMGKERRSKE
jgi:hypothetical protein